ncbi:MAG TPA: DUF1579 family protein [Fimbriimonadaceae bacterium]|nr:DUF1579 family protein [Fimbriimonadaceae bacterium]
MHLIALGSLLIGLAAGGQNHGTEPAVAMGKLDFMIGEWKGKQTFYIGNGREMVGDASDHAEWAVGKRFVEEHLSTSLTGRPATDTRHMLAYDPRADQYVAYWFNDTSPLPLVLTGKLNDGKLVLLTTSPSGGHNQLRFTYDGSTHNELSLTFEMETSGVWQTQFKTVYSK